MRREAVDILLRLGTAFTLFFPATDAFLNPYRWIGYIPEFLQDFTSPMLVLQVFGVFQIVLALWILSGRNIVSVSLVVTGMFLCAVFFNTDEFDVFFRNISLSVMPLALALLHYQKRNPHHKAREQQESSAT